MPWLEFVLLAAALLLVAGLTVGMALLKGAVRRNNRVRTPEEQVFGSGERGALLLYQPSNHGSNAPLAQALAEAVAEAGYTVTVNYPTEQLPYNPEDYDLLIFGAAVYMGQVAEPLKKYLATHPFGGKQVIFFVTGRLSERAETDELAALAARGNRVASIKLSPSETGRLLDFVRERIE